MIILINLLTKQININSDQRNGMCYKGRQGDKN